MKIEIISSGDKNRAWQEIANIVHKKWDNICVTAKTELVLHRRSQRQTDN
jgi:ActR/RegA family two-component response regulator